MNRQVRSKVYILQKCEHKSHVQEYYQVLFTKDKTQNELLKEEYPLREETIDKWWYIHKMEYYTAMKMNGLKLGTSI